MQPCRKDTAIVQSVVAMGEALGLDVIGEGIETAAQAKQLQALGCNRGQGYLFAPPMPAEQFEAALRADDSAAPNAGHWALQVPCD